MPPYIPYWSIQICKKFHESELLKTSLSRQLFIKLNCFMSAISTSKQNTFNFRKSLEVFSIK